MPWPSLNPKSISLTALLYRTPTEMCYKAVALRDIDVGDEITCDYVRFNDELVHLRNRNKAYKKILDDFFLNVENVGEQISYDYKTRADIRNAI